MQAMALTSVEAFPGPDVQQRERIISGLNKQLASLTDLAIAYKQAHWNVVGPNFAQFHALFDRFTDQVREYTDLIAERAVALGGTADGTLQAAAEHTSLPPFPRAERDERRLVQELAWRVDRLVGELRGAMLDSAADLPTQDLYSEIIQGLEKQRWMLLAHLDSAPWRSNPDGRAS